MIARRPSVLLAIAVGFCSAVSTIAVAQQPSFSIPLQLDGGGQPLNGAAHRYTLTFSATSLPPAKEWALALYQLPDQSWVKNSIDRHAITSWMLPSLHRDPDGGITIYIQRDPPSGKRKANWLPAPDGQFILRLQLDDPAQSVLTGAWEPPPVERIE